MRVSKRMSCEEAAYTPVFDLQMLLPSVASSLEPRPACLRRVALESDFFPTWDVYFDSFQARARGERDRRCSGYNI